MEQRKAQLLKAMLLLGRFKMTIFSAVTYATSASFVLQQDAGIKFGALSFIFGYFFVLFCQLVAHYSGEYYDFPSDQLNVHSSPLTGGSKILVRGLAPRSICMVLTVLCSFGCFLFLSLLLYSNSSFGFFCEQNQSLMAIGVSMFIIAHQYCSPPLMLNHNGFGEAGAALVMNVLLPWFAALVLDTENIGNYRAPSVAFRKLSILVIPATFLKFSLFLVLNMEDRRPDWQGKKYTIPVIYGEKFSARMASLFIFFGYLSALILYLLGLCKLRTLSFVMLSAPSGIDIAVTLLKPLPYQLRGLVLRCLKHAPIVVLAIFFDTLVDELWTLRCLSISLLLRTLPILPFTLMFVARRKISKTAEVSEIKELDNILIVGGGIGGLTLAAALNCLGIRFTVFEKRDETEQDTGADLAIWPEAARFLYAVGVGRDSDFWAKDFYQISTVFMCHLNSEGKEDVLKVVDMAKVCRGCTRLFSLVTRNRLMSALKSAVPSTNIVKVRLDDGREFVGKLVVGADGWSSVCRKHVAPAETPKAKRHGGEMCYRGLIDFEDESNADLKKIFDEQEAKRPNSMSLVYAGNIRYSWGYIDSNLSTGYWFVKQKFKKNGVKVDNPFTEWPYPLGLFAKKNPVDIYAHDIQDSKPLTKWSSLRVVLIGDACHAVTPNSGKGSCLAIEDAFVLATLLRKYWNEYDGHVEAMYQFEQERKVHTKRVYVESHKQMKIGQLSGPVGTCFRNSMLKMVPTSVLESKLRDVNTFPSKPWLSAFNSLKGKNK